MTIDERYAYLQIQYECYCRATKPEKNCLLDEMMAVTGLTRNHLIELLQHPPKRQARQQQRHNSYAAATDAALQVLWEAQNYIGAERLPSRTLAHGAGPGAGWGIDLDAASAAGLAIAECFYLASPSPAVGHTGKPPARRRGAPQYLTAGGSRPPDSLEHY